MLEVKRAQSIHGKGMSLLRPKESESKVHKNKMEKGKEQRKRKGKSNERV